MDFNTSNGTGTLSRSAADALGIGGETSPTQAETRPVSNENDVTAAYNRGRRDRERATAAAMPEDARIWLDAARAAGLRVSLGCMQNEAHRVEISAGTATPPAVSFFLAWRAARIREEELTAALAHECAAPPSSREDDIKLLELAADFDGSPAATDAPSHDNPKITSCAHDRYLLETMSAIEPNTVEGYAAMARVLNADRESTGLSLSDQAAADAQGGMIQQCLDYLANACHAKDANDHKLERLFSQWQELKDMRDVVDTPERIDESLICKQLEIEKFIGATPADTVAGLRVHFAVFDAHLPNDLEWRSGAVEGAPYKWGIEHAPEGVVGSVIEYARKMAGTGS